MSAVQDVNKKGNSAKKKVTAKKDIAQFCTTGRRKAATARIRLFSPGNGRIVVNSRSIKDYFTRETHRLVIEQPIKLVSLSGKIDIRVNVCGGGMTGQAEATRHGIARAIIKFNDSLRGVLKKAGFLTRDSRIKERKKFGRKRARKRFQFSKR